MTQDKMRSQNNYEGIEENEAYHILRSKPSRFVITPVFKMNLKIGICILY